MLASPEPSKGGVRVKSFQLPPLRSTCPIIQPRDSSNDQQPDQQLRARRKPGPSAPHTPPPRILAMPQSKLTEDVPTNTLTTGVCPSQCVAESWQRLGPGGLPELNRQCHGQTQTPEGTGRRSGPPRSLATALSLPQQFSKLTCRDRAEDTHAAQGAQWVTCTAGYVTPATRNPITSSYETTPNRKKAHPQHNTSPGWGEGGGQGGKPF